MRFEVPLVLSVLSCWVPAARGDAFYVCTKKGEHPKLINSATLASTKRMGYRCRKRMDFGGEDEAPQRAHSRSGASGGGGSSTVSSPRRFSGPAGEAGTYEPWILEAADRYNVPAHLVRAVIRVESNFHPTAVSEAGAQGLMQLMPGTAKEMGVSDPFDARQNIFGGTRYLRVLINRFAGDAKLAIAAYHAGPGVVARRGEIPFEATRRYVKNVLKHFLKYRDSR